MEVIGNMSRSHAVGVKHGQGPKIVSDFVCFLFQVVVFIALCGLVSAAGIIANVINLVVFVRQGLLVDSVTTSLAGLAVADLFCLLTMLWHSISYAILLEPPPNLTFDPMSVMYVTAGWPHVMFTRVTCWITSYIALERCLCVLLPFKVKQLFTAGRSMVVVTSIFIIITISYIPIYYTHQLHHVLDLTTNVTILRLVFTPDKDRIENICHHINDVIMPTFSLAIVIVCTRLTISRLNVSTKWRKKNANSNYVSTGNENQNATNDISSIHAANEELKPKSQPTTTSSPKETKVVRMITLICIIFVICNSPCIFIIYLRFVVPEIANMGRYHNLFHVLYAVDFLLESVGSAINMVVYVNMSTRYRQELFKLFARSS